LAEEVKALPIYEYVCSCCSARFEIKQGFSDEAKTFCHFCGSKARRVFSPVPIIFKGSGFYVTDSRAAASGKLGGRGNGSGAAGSGEGKGTTEESEECIAS